MPIVLALVFVFSTAAAAAAQAPVPQPPAAQVPAVFISPAEIAQLLESGIVKSAVDQPIKGADVLGGKTVVAMLHRDRAEAGADSRAGNRDVRIPARQRHDHHRGTLGTPKPSDLTRRGRADPRPARGRAARAGRSAPATS